MTHQLLSDPRYDILGSLLEVERAEMRLLITHCILSTDMAKHAEELDQMVKCASDDPPFDKSNKSSRYMLLAFVMHSAGNVP